MKRIPVSKRWAPGLMIPGAEETIGTDRSSDRIVLEHYPWTATIWSDGEIDIHVDSRGLIASGTSAIGLDPDLTQELRKRFEASDREELTDDDWIEEWLRDKHAKLIGYGLGHTSRLGHWTGSSFAFAEFIMRGKSPNDGAVIIWSPGVRPEDLEVYRGDFEGFLSEHGDPEDDPSTAEGFRDQNYFFENGLIWAMGELGLLDDPKKMPPHVAEALARFKAEERRLIELQLGQKYLWPDLYLGGR